MRLYRARAVRGALPSAFDPLDSSGSTARKGWRFNDPYTEILYTAQTQALAVLEIAVRPGWETVDSVLVAEIDTGKATIADLHELGIALPSNWNSRPSADDARSIAREFLNAIAAIAPPERPIGVRVPSVLSTTDFNVLVDPSRKKECTAGVVTRLAFKAMRETAS